jgi:hypothetical protein
MLLVFTGNLEEKDMRDFLGMVIWEVVSSLSAALLGNLEEFEVLKFGICFLMIF